MALHHILEPSAVQKLLQGHQSDLTSSSDNHQHLVALQIAHNLKHQHNWTNLRLHSKSAHDGRRLAVPLISGVPPERLYIHPDEQIDLLQKQKNEGKVGMPVLHSEPEWVLPTHLRERWTLARFAEVFDAIEVVPSQDQGDPINFDSTTFIDLPINNAANSWRTNKRLLLATVDDDSTVVYYIIHDGIVKPRQN